MEKTSWQSAFETRTDLNTYENNALLIFALELRWGIEDIHSVAAESLTDGQDDKKCDLIFVDRDKGVIVIAQGYASTTGKTIAPSNKAADLNTAVTWLLLSDMSAIPERIKTPANDVRNSLKEGDIDSLELWYVHNCSESDNVEKELAAVEKSAQAALKNNDYSNCEEIRAVEVGKETLEEWYRAKSIPILVNDEFSVKIPGGYELKTEKWVAYTTAVPLSWLYKLYLDYGKRLFSANYRDYLGSRHSDSNINYGIKSSAESNPDEFWAFNNGITALVNAYKEHESTITIKGLSIVNGAKTTGAVGSISTVPSESAQVAIRFIKCSSNQVIRDIIKYNNSQNKMLPSDFRSNDAVQERLREEFSKYPSSPNYLGGRRGDEADAIRRPSNLISSDTAAQSLAAFHNQPGLAYNQKGQIWKSDVHYPNFFNEKTHADHIIFTYSLNQIIADEQLRLKTETEGSLTDEEHRKLEFFRFRGAISILMAAIGSCMESIFTRKITDRFLLRFKRQIDLSGCKQLWRPIAIDCCLSFNHVLIPVLEDGLSKEFTTSIQLFQSLVQATTIANKNVYQEFADEVLSTPRKQ